MSNTEQKYTLVNLYERQKYLTQLFENYHNYAECGSSYMSEDINVIQSAINSGYPFHLITKLISRTQGSLNGVLCRLDIARKGNSKFNSISIVKSKDGYMRIIPTPEEHQPVRVAKNKTMSFDYAVYFLNRITPETNYLIMAREEHTDQKKLIFLKKMIVEDTIPEYIKPFLNQTKPN